MTDRTVTEIRWSGSITADEEGGFLATLDTIRCLPERRHEERTVGQTVPAAMLEGRVNAGRGNQVARALPSGARADSLRVLWRPAP